MNNQSKNDSKKNVKESELDVKTTPTFSSYKEKENKKAIVLEEKKKYKVILVDKYSITLEDEQGNGITKYGSFDAKVGETIEI